MQVGQPVSVGEEDKDGWWSSKQPSSDFDGRRTASAAWCVQVLRYILVLRSQTMFLLES